MKTINALLSCPSDVLNNYGEDIYRAINDVNLYIEKILDTHINIQHYLTSSYSQVGKPAQDHLDDTLIVGSDICLAFYYHRLGTATKNYKSGTDEEIHLMRNSGKHVSLFRIFDNNSDTKCEKELNDYFDSIGSFSMYKTITGKENVFNEVRIDILNYLVSSFNLELIKIDKPFNSVDYFKKIIYFDNKKNKIISLINKINKITENKSTIDKSFEKAIEENKNNEQLKELINKESYTEIAKRFKTNNAFDFNGFMKKEATIEEIFDNTSTNYLYEFAKENSLELKEDFVSFQNIKVFRDATPINGGLCLNGCPIKEKIENLIKLSNSLKNYFEWISYLEKYKGTVLVPLAIFNNTTSFQESINISVHINPNEYISNFSLKPFGCVADEMYVIGLDTFLNPYKRYAGYEEYSYPPLSQEVARSAFPVLTTDYEATLINWFEEYFDYEIERTDKEITLKLHFRGINAGDKHCFPTYLVLKNTIKEIGYELTGSSLSRKQFGKIVFN